MSSTTTNPQAAAAEEIRPTSPETIQPEPPSQTDSATKTPPKSTSLFAATYGDGTPGKKKAKALFMAKSAKAAVDDLKAIGTFHKTSGGELYFSQKKPSPKIIPLESDDVRLKLLINNTFHINAASGDIFNHIVTAMQMYAYEKGTIADVHQFAHVNRDTKTAYVSFLDGATMLKLTGGDLPDVVPNGTDGVFFINDPRCDPWSLVVEEVCDFQGDTYAIQYDNGAAKRYLVDPIEFQDTDHLTREDQQWLFEMWLRSLLLELSERPLVLLYGVPGSGKTLALQRVKKALFGQSMDVDSASSEDAFTAAVSNSALIVLDNIDRSYSKWLADNLAKASTGVSFTKRALYTTNNLVTFPARAAIALTAFSPSFIENGPDLADRTLVFGLSRVKGNFKGRGEAFKIVLDHRDEILTDLALSVNDYIRHWRKQEKEETSPLRLADFGILLQNYAKLENQQERAKKVFTVLQQSQTDLLVEHDSLIMGIQEWLEKHPGQECSGTAGDVAKIIFEMTGVRMTAGVVGRKINSMWTVLQKRFGAIKKPGRSRAVRYFFKDVPGDMVKAGEETNNTSSPISTSIDAGS